MLNQDLGAHLTTAGTVVRCEFDKKDPTIFHVSFEFAEVQ